MRKNRAQGIRTLTIDGVNYQWLVSDHNCDGDGGNRLQVWKNKKRIIEEVVSGSEVITPKVVSTKIQAAVQ